MGIALCCACSHLAHKHRNEALPAWCKAPFANDDMKTVNYVAECPRTVAARDDDDDDKGKYSKKSYKDDDDKSYQDDEGKYSKKSYKDDDDKSYQDDDDKSYKKSNKSKKTKKDGYRRLLTTGADSKNGGGADLLLDLLEAQNEAHNSAEVGWNCG